MLHAALRITGMVAAVFTPMKEGALELDLSVVPKYAAMLVSKNITKVLAAGTTGESLSLSVDERKRLAEAWAEAGRAHGISVYVHVGAESLADTLDLTAHAAKTTGVTGIVCQTPLFFKPGVEALHNYLAAVGRVEPRLPLWYYHFPGRTGVLNGQAHKLVEMIHEKGEIPNFMGVKFTDPNLGDFQLCKAAGDGSYNMLYGKDDQYVAAAALGADGMVGSTMQFSPATRKAFQLSHSGKIEDARPAQLAAAQLCDYLAENEMQGKNAQKSIMRMTGFSVGPSRLPWLDLTQEEYSRLDADLRSRGLIDLPKEESSKLLRGSPAQSDGLDTAERQTAHAA